MATYYVGTRYEGPQQEVRVCVKGCKADAQGLDKVRAIEADSSDEAAVKYVELITGKRAGLRNPS